jgi:hypothetical protein
VKLAVFQRLIYRFNGEFKIIGCFFRRPALGAHTTEQLADGKAPAIEYKLLAPRMRARNEIFISSFRLHAPVDSGLRPLYMLERLAWLASAERGHPLYELGRDAGVVERRPVRAMFAGWALVTTQGLGQ